MIPLYLCLIRSRLYIVLSYVLCFQVKHVKTINDSSLLFAIAIMFRFTWTERAGRLS